MEIKFSRVFGLGLTNASFTIPGGTICGLSGEGSRAACDIITSFLPQKGSVFLGDTKKLVKDKKKLEKQVVFIKKKFENEFGIDQIYSYFCYYIKYYQIKVNHIHEKIRGAMKIVGLDEKLLDKSFSSLSCSELKLVQLALHFLLNPNIIILEEPFLSFDEKEKKKVLLLLERLTDKLNKTVIILSDDSEVLLQTTSYLVLFSNGHVVVEGNTLDVYFNNEKLEESKIELPEIVSFIKLVKERKNVKLMPRKDIKDMIKDIYRITT